MLFLTSIIIPYVLGLACPLLFVSYDTTWPQPAYFSSCLTIRTGLSLPPSLRVLRYELASVCPLLFVSYDTNWPQSAPFSSCLTIRTGLSLTPSLRVLRYELASVWPLLLLSNPLSFSFSLRCPAIYFKPSICIASRKYFFDILRLTFWCVPLYQKNYICILARALLLNNFFTTIDHSLNCCWI